MKREIGLIGMVACIASLGIWLPKPADPPKKATGYYAFYEHWKARRQMGGKINWDAYRNAREEWSKQSVSLDVASLRWEQVGPFNLAVPYQIYFGNGPLGGRVNAIAYHPTNANIIYAGLATGGLWRSGDAGKNWTCLSKGWPIQSISKIVLDPVLPNRIYVGTGDTHGGMAQSYGIMRSVDSGATWSTFLNSTSELGSVGVNSMIVAPTNRNILLASGTDTFGTRANLYRSTTWGSTWALNDDTVTIHDLDIAPSGSPRRIYVLASSGTGAFIASSVDNGASWGGPSASLPLSNPRGLDLGASKSDPNFVYVLSGSEKKVFSVDFTNGANPSVNDLTGGFPAGGSGQAEDYNWSQGTYNYHLTVGNNRGQDELYVGQIDLAWTGDGNWFSLGGPSYSEASLIHNDQHSMAMHPTNPDVALVGNDGGLFRLNWTGRTNMQFTSLNGNLPTQMFTSGAFHPNNPNIMIGGTQDNATPIASGNLKAWKNVSGGDGGQAIIHPKNPNVQYASAQFAEIYVTDDAWKTTNLRVLSPVQQGEESPFVTPLAVDPSIVTQVYTGGEYVYRYDALLGTWSPRLGNYRIGVFGAISAIEVAPSLASRIYAAAPRRIAMSADRGVTWKLVGSTPDEFSEVADIAVHPTNPNWVLAAVNHATVGPSIWQCQNPTLANPTWTRLAGGLPEGIGMNCVSFDPTVPNTTFYVGTDLGIYRTIDAGASWSNISKQYGLPSVQVNAVQAVPGTGYLMAATFGQGMWRLPLTNLPPNLIKSVTVSPTAVKIGGTATATVTLNAPAPASGYGFTLSTNKAWATVPNTVLVPAGKTTATFKVITKKPASFPVAQSAAIYADLGMQRKYGFLKANP